MSTNAQSRARKWWYRLPGARVLRAALRQLRIGMRDNEAFLFRWKSGSAVPEPIGRIAQTVDAQSATISLDDDGVVRGFGRVGKILVDGSIERHEFVRPVDQQKAIGGR